MGLSWGYHGDMMIWMCLKQGIGTDLRNGHWVGEIAMNQYEKGNFWVPYFVWKHILKIPASNSRRSPTIWDETTEHLGFDGQMPGELYSAPKMSCFWEGCSTPVQANKRYVIYPRSLFISDGFTQVNWPTLGFEWLKMGRCWPEMP